MNYAFAAQESIKNSAVNLNAWDAIIHASFIVQLTLIILVGLSVSCWAVFIYKSKKIKQMKKEDKVFLNIFREAPSLDTVAEAVSDYPDSSIARVFREGYEELKKIADLNSNFTSSENKISENKKPLLSGIDNVERALGKSLENELSSLEHQITILSTTGSSGPFIGLFGTVWGIMGSFQSIGATGSASLAAVAPGISEALVATAVGLAAAIPATAMYNHFVKEIKKHENLLFNFSSDFLNIVKRNFFER